MRRRSFGHSYLGGALLAATLATIPAVAALTVASCTSEFPTAHSSSILTMSLANASSKIRGTPEKRLALSFTDAYPFQFNFAALGPDGSVDTSFNGFVRVSAHPGNIVSASGSGAEGRNVLLTNGVAKNVQINVLAAYGDTHLWAEDIGYQPADPAGKVQPECSDGIDNNGNGLIDFPADPGCAYANDNSEDGGEFTTGISDDIYFESPRIADVRGVGAGSTMAAPMGGTATAFPSEQVQVDTGYRDQYACSDGTAPPCYEFPAVPAVGGGTISGVIVTRISPSGFFVTDVSDTRGFSSVYAYNFSAPPNMKICDRLTSFGGTSSDFFGFTEVNYPTWTIDSWVGYAPGQKNPGRPCGVPDSRVLIVTDQMTGSELPVTPATTEDLLDSAAAMVRVQTGSTVRTYNTSNGQVKVTYNTAIHVGAHFGQNHPASPTYTPTTNATNCDLDGDGKITFSTPEGTCSDACTADAECTEYSSYLGQSQFRLVIVQTNSDGSTVTGAVLGNAAQAAQFDPLVNRGVALRAFSGTLTYFSGGSQFTIEARCPDDIVTDLKASPLPSNVACVGALNSSSEESN